MNVAMPIAAVLLDLGFDPALVKAVPILARTAGLLAHLAEEREQPLGFLWPRPRRRPSSTNDGPRRVRGPSSSSSTTPPTASSSPTCSSARRSTARSSRGATRRARRDRRPAADREGRSFATTVTAGAPVRRALRRQARARSSASTRRAARRARRATSRSPRATSTTGSPARRAATRPPGSSAGQRIVSTYNAGPFVAGAALAVVRPHRPHPHPGRDGEHRAAAPRRSSGCGRRRRCSRRRTRRTCSSGDAPARPASRAWSACSSRASPAAASRRSARSSRTGWGARVTEAMGIGDIGVSLWGECEEQDGMHLGARGFVHAELIDPDTGAAIPMEDGAERRARPHAPAAPRRAAPALPHARPRGRPDERLPLRPHRPADPLHRPHRRHADRPRRERLPVRDPRDRERRSPEANGQIVVQPEQPA